MNDCNVEGMCHIRETPEAYMEQIIGLREQSAAVGGVRLHGAHDMSNLVHGGRSAAPVQLDMSTADESMRAGYLEVMLRKLRTHPAVEGVML